MTSQSTERSSLSGSHWMVLAALTLTFLWAYWTTLEELAEEWSQDPQYSHGYLVPVVAVALVWFRRRQFAAQPMQPSLWGIALLLLGTGIRLASAYLYYFWPDRISILPVVAGVCVAVGGWRALRWAWPSIVFLVFMMPLPSSLQGLLTDPLQHVATESATYLLQTLGLPAQAEGNVILLSEVDLGVVEACNGLRMMVTFFAVAAAVVLLLQPEWWQALVILISAIPIAIICNVVRLVTTGILYETVGEDIAQFAFHGWPGPWLMMALASALLYLELVLLSRLFIVVPDASSSTLARLVLKKDQPPNPGTKPPSALQRAVLTQRPAARR
jgi:exosortase